MVRRNNARATPAQRSKARQPELAPSIAQQDWATNVFAWICLLVAVFFVTFRPLSDPDTWFHLAFGKWFAEHGSIPFTDPFAGSSPGREWVSSGWLASVLMYPSYRAAEGSGIGLLLMVFVVIAATYGLVLFAAQRWFADRGYIAVPLLLALGAACMRFSPRPDIFSHLMLACILLILVLTDRLKPTGSPPWFFYLLLPAFALWSNLHAGFPVGLIILFIYAAWSAIRSSRDERPWRYFRSQYCVLSALAVLLNPYGSSIALLGWKIARIPKVDWIMEWMPLFRRGFPMPTAVYICAGLLLAVTMFTLWRTRTDWWRLLAIGVLVGLSILQRRQLGPAVIGICVLLLPSLPRLTAMQRMPRFSAPALALILCAGICLAKVGGYIGGGGGVPRAGQDCNSLPCVATDFLVANPPPEKLFNSYQYGGYLLYHLGPSTKVYIDGRLDVYDPQVYLDALAVEENRISTEQIEKKYGVRTWVLSIDDAIGDPMHLASRLALQPWYALVHFDDQSAVFVKRDPVTNGYIAKNEFHYVNPFNLKLPSEVLRTNEADAALNEVQRALNQSMGSASANALAGLYAAVAGDAETAGRMLDNARARDPNNRVLQQVTGLLKPH
jgi:hypothetical protein